MRPQRPLALLLSLLIAGQPALLHAASIENVTHRDHRPKGAAHTRKAKSPDLKPVFALLTSGGYRDKTAEREMEELIGSIVSSLPPEAIDELTSMAALVAGNPGDPAILQEASQRFGQTMDALPDETRDEIQRFVAAGFSMAGLGFAISAILKFKAHKDNPNPPKIGQPIALVFLAAALLFLPSIIGVGPMGPASCETCSDACAVPAGVESDRSEP